MHQMTDTDQLLKHPSHAQERAGDVQHACPDCPSPLTVPGQLQLAPKTFCPWCYGTGLVTTETLDRYQARMWADARKA